MPLSIRGLAKFMKGMVFLCDVIEEFGPRIRKHVPTESVTAYDNALSAILAACEILRAIDYLDGWTGTNPPFGSAFD